MSFASLAMTNRVEFKLIAELVKNSRRSDRELAKAIGVSQPTVSRTLAKLEKEGVIKGYTVIPDFSKLGYEIMGITSLYAVQKPQINPEEMKDPIVEVEENSPQAGLMTVAGVGQKANRLFIGLYKNYSAYTRTIDELRKSSFADLYNVNTFMVDLKDETNFRLSSMEAITKHILMTNEQRIARVKQESKTDDSVKRRRLNNQNSHEKRV